MGKRARLARSVDGPVAEQDFVAPARPIRMERETRRAAGLGTEATRQREVPHVFAARAHRTRVHRHIRR